MPQGGTLMIGAANKTLDASNGAAPADVMPGDYVVLTVTDTGSGILPNDLDRVFDPFFSTKDVGQGSGLELSMVYGFAK